MAGGPTFCVSAARNNALAIGTEHDTIHVVGVAHQRISCLLARLDVPHTGWFVETRGRERAAVRLYANATTVSSWACGRLADLVEAAPSNR